MRVDLYTKIVLTVIALSLVAIAVNPIVHPRPIEAQSAASYQFVGVSGGLMVIDQQADMWFYPMDFANHSGGYPVGFGRISKLGEYPTAMATH